MGNQVSNMQAEAASAKPFIRPPRIADFFTPLLLVTVVDAAMKDGIDTHWNAA